MIGKTGEGWLFSIAKHPLWSRGHVERFYQDIDQCKRRGKEIILPCESSAKGFWGNGPNELPKPGDGFAFYHSSDAGFPPRDKFKKRPRITAMGTLKKFIPEGRDKDRRRYRIDVSMRVDVLEFLRANPIVHPLHPVDASERSLKQLFDYCIPPRSIATFYKVTARAWSALVSRLPKQSAGQVPAVALPDDEDEPPETVVYTSNRRVRNTDKGQELKTLYGCKCQVCGYRICVPTVGSGWLIEVHHLRPLGGEHRGLDNWDNMLVLCPNCHAEFDALAMAVDPKTRLITCYDDRNPKAGKEIEFRSGHLLAVENIKYHWKRFREVKSSL